MNSFLLEPRSWAELEFGETELGDARRTERLVEVATAMGLKPGTSLPMAMESAAELKATYRLFSRPELTHEVLMESHCKRIQEACCKPGRYLLIGDTTLLDYSSHKATEGLGCIGAKKDHRGLLLHSTLAIAFSSSRKVSALGHIEIHHETELLGIFDQRLWKRSNPSTASKKERKIAASRARTIRPRESDRWIEVLEKMIVPEQTQWIYVADRESDIYECLQQCEANGVDFVIRASRPRRLFKKEGNLFKAVADAPLLGTTQLKLRAQPGSKARTVTLELRVIEVELKGPYRPGGQLKPMKVTVVEAREKVPPKSAKEAEETKTKAKGKAKDAPLRWVLLTRLPASTLGEVLEVVAIYRERWLVEHYHKALKTGMGVERFQLESANSLESAIGIVAILAARLLGLQLLAAIHPSTPLPADCSDPQILAYLETRYGRPPEGWTVAAYLRAIARLGGFIARKSDGDPGWITIWRGILQLSILLNFLDLKNSPSRCG
ncbi:MAG: IS4 family transposase [Chitinophagaceae bacterium]|nr:MAG: IS4 family transposase [Chitinophagaceae bacterium]